MHSETVKFLSEFFFRESVDKIQVSLKSEKNKGYFAWRPISRTVLLRMAFFRQKLYRKSKHTFCVHQLCFENHAFYEIMWKNNMVEPDRPPMKIWRMRIACWIPKATDIHSEYVTLTDFPLQQWLHERASTLHYTTLPVLLSTFLPLQ